MIIFLKSKRFLITSFTVICCVISIGVVAWLGIGNLSQSQVHASANEGFNIGQWPPNFSARDLDGTLQSLKQYQGKIVVLHFWATWCPYCRGEIPKLVKIHREMADQGVAVLTISIDDDLNKLSDFVKRAKLPYPVIVDRTTRPLISERYAIPGIPVTFILARDGRIIARSVGASNIIDAVNQAIELDS